MFDSHIISALGWTLIHFIWQGAAIVITYWLISRSSKSLHAKYWTGMVAVILCLLIPFSQFISLIQSTEAVQSTFTISSSYQSMALKPMSIWDICIMLTNQSLPYLVLIWAAVVCALTSSLVRSWFKLNAIEHDCDATLSAELKQFIKSTAIKLDLATIPILKVSKKILVPAAYGMYKPTVLLPLSLLSQLPKDQIHAIITHELCHLKRNDFIHNILQLTADILLFFHPLIRWMNNDIRQVREQCCDQLVLSQNTHAITYAKALTNIASLSNGHSFGPRIQIGINDGLLLKRVKFLLQKNSSQSSIMMFIPLAILLLACFYLFQSDQQTLGFEATQSNQAVSSKPKLNKRVVSNLFYPNADKFYPNADKFYPNADKMGHQEVFVPAAAEISAPIRSYNTLPTVNIKNDITVPSPAINDPFFSTVTQQPLINLREDLESSFKMSPSLIEPTPIKPINNQGNISESHIISTAFNNQSAIKGTPSLLKPKLKAYLAPEYPQEFWKKQVEQTVIASFKIKANGKLHDIKMSSQGNNHTAFEQSVKTTLREWRFETASLTRPSTQRTYQQIFEFKLSKVVEKNCQNTITGTRIKQAAICKQ